MSVYMTILRQFPQANSISQRSESLLLLRFLSQGLIKILFRLRQMYPAIGFLLRRVRKPLDFSLPVRQLHITNQLECFFSQEEVNVLPSNFQPRYLALSGFRQFVSASNVPTSRELRRIALPCLSISSQLPLLWADISTCINFWFESPLRAGVGIVSGQIESSDLLDKNAILIPSFSIWNFRSCIYKCENHLASSSAASLVKYFSNPTPNNSYPQIRREINQVFSAECPSWFKIRCFFRLFVPKI